MKHKTLQEQYNLIKEGKGNTELFMKDAKHQFPQYVRNAATLNETIGSLKHNHIISESFLMGGMVVTDAPKQDWFEIFNENLSEAKVVEKSPSKEVEDLKKSNFDYTDPKNIDNVFGQEFLNGYYCEIKDPKNAEKTIEEVKEIVAKNLAKDKLYYVKNGQFGEKIGYTDELPGLKASKSDQMEKVKMNEGRISLLSLVEGVEEESPEVKPEPKKEPKSVKKESIQDRIKEIEKRGSIAALEAKINALDEEIAMREGKITMVEGNEDLAEFVNPARVNEIKREVKDLTKAKEKYSKIYEKMSGKSYVKPQVVGETEELA